MPLPQLRRVRWAIRAALALGVAASVAANILHARPNPISQVIAAWPPLALLITVELISRVPVHRRALAAVRLLATATIAGIAAWVSYWHMVGVASRYGETGASPYLLPLSVDGLVIVASVSLVELAGRIRAVETATARQPLPDGVTVISAPDPAPVTEASVTEAPVTEAPVTEAPVTEAPVADAEPKRAPRSPARRTGQSRVTKATPAKSAPRKRASAKTAPTVAPGTAGRELSSAELVKLAELVKADRPELTQAAIANELGVTRYRLQQAKREAVGV
ncbi:DUF2637 domain-containing protein [Planosporangium thailandense]|uniref:DUF2637 domain-containing protein n=1 Tax=Planosporangium thailandense TaxID=765197 RepID=A0ABX0XT29_9ACTN|nr:DUF2637 domain-containing protein [Planosporangium thailandense]NJC68393.1 DUF2637 domain-containing protein [Planosporangium thailandense]